MFNKKFQLNYYFILMLIKRRKQIEGVGKAVTEAEKIGKDSSVENAVRQQFEFFIFA